MSSLDNPILETENVKPGSIALRYGLIGGLVLIALGLVTQLTGLVDLSDSRSTTNRLISMLNYVVMIVIIVMAIKAYLAEGDGFATFGRAFKIGFLASLVMAGISLVWVYLYFGLIDTSIIETIREAAVEQVMDQQGMSEDEAEQAVSIMGFMFNPVGMAIMSGITLTFMGTIFSLVIGAIMKKNPPEMA